MTAGRDDDEFLADLDRWVADAGADEASRHRSQQRMLVEAASQEATFTGAVLDLAERGDVVVVQMVTTHSHRGRVVAVGHDFVVLRDGDRGPTFIPFTAISTIRPHPELAIENPSGARAAPLAGSFAAVLGGIAAERPRVNVIAVGDDHTLAGELRAVGADVATLYLDGPNRPRAFVRLASLASLTLLDWG